jgi:protein TonB
MKNLFLVFIALFILTSAKAQRHDTLKGKAADTLVFAAVQQSPQFPGGLTEFYHYVMKTVRYPAQSKSNKTQGRVIVTMIVEKDGSISHTKVIRSVAPDLDREALRVINSSPKWQPGIQNGKPVRVMYSIPISFALAN